MTGGPRCKQEISPPPRPSPHPFLSPVPHPAFQLPESLRGMARTSQYQSIVRNYEQCAAEAAAEAAASEAPAAPLTVQQQPGLPQFRVPKQEPRSPSPQKAPLASCTVSLPPRQEGSRSGYSSVPPFNSLGGYFIIYGFTPARIDPNTGLVVNSLTAPLPPGAQLAYVPPSHNPFAPMMNPMMNPMMVPQALQQVVNAAMQTQMQQQQQNATATAVITETADIKPVVHPNGGGIVRQEAGGMAREKQELMMKREKGEMREMREIGDEGGDDRDSDFSELTLSSSGESSISSGDSIVDVDTEIVKGEGGAVFITPKLPPPSSISLIPSLPPPPSNTFSSISGHPLATSSPIRDKRAIKKELLPNFDSSRKVGKCIKLDKERLRLLKNKLGMTSPTLYPSSTRHLTRSIPTPMVDVGSPGGTEDGLVLESFVKTEETPMKTPEGPSGAHDVTPMPSSPPRSSRAESNPITTTPLMKKVTSDGIPIERRPRNRNHAITALSLKMSELSDAPALERKVTKANGRKKKKMTLPSRGSARLAARNKSFAIEEEDPARGSAKIAALKRTAKAEKEGEETPRVKKIKKELLKFYVKHVVMATTGNEEQLKERDAMIKKELKKHIKGRKK